MKRKHPKAELTPKPREEALPPEVRPGQSVELLKQLHILTRDAKLNQDSRRKLKQVYHLFQFIEGLLQELPHPSADHPSGPLVADHGAGKSYLGFITYDLHLKALGRGTIYGIETRSELVESSRALAQRLGFERMKFLNLSVAESTGLEELPPRFDMVTALHACDTATDDAIHFGLQKQARFMVLVPCCQAELAASLRLNKALQLSRTPLAELWRHPLHTRELGSQLTNVLRCLYLESQGYSVTVTELVGWEHSMKNELILARFTGHRKHSAGQRLKALLQEFALEPLLATRYPALAGAPSEAVTGGWDSSDGGDGEATSELDPGRATEAAAADKTAAQSEPRSEATAKHDA
jgi:hypothetical protein